jgi:formylglycine-generating enzyme required for sulfatase activity
MRLRVLRGGSWNNNRNNARCAYRNRNTPNLRLGKNNRNNNGICVVSSA